MSYRTIKLELLPDSKTEKPLIWAEVQALKFIDLGVRDYQNQLYHKFAEVSNLNSYTVALLAQRFTGSFRGKTVVPFNAHNSKFVNENGCWFVELALLRRSKEKNSPRLRVPIAKTGNKYYDLIGSSNARIRVAA